MKKVDFKYVKEMLRRLSELDSDIWYVFDHRKVLEKSLKRQCEDYLGLKALDALEGIPVEELKNSKAGIRVSAIKDAGYDNLLQLAKLKEWEMTAIEGIGEKQAESIRNLIAEFINGMAKHVHLQFSLEKNEDGVIPNAEMLLTLAKLRNGDLLRRLAEELSPELEEKLKWAKMDIEIQNPVRWFFASKDAKERTAKAISDLESFLDGETCQKAREVVRDYQVIRNWTINDALEDFQNASADYYAILEQYGGAAKENPLIYSSIPAQLAQAIDESPIDLSQFKGNLRSYQLFGAKYVLFERRVLLGDEMGLGKTVQAIAAMCDVYARDRQSLFLVICPASVLINWCREVKKFSTMDSHLLHGAYLEEEFEAWKEQGGVAVTNFESMEKLVRKIDGKLKLAMLVIDEAHYIKNPDARRTQNVRALNEESERILMMTGTPLENRVEEMCSLIEFARPDMVEEVRKNAFMSHAPQFREILAPVYLRRQRDQVLQELPPIEEMQEWCELTEGDREGYAYVIGQKSFNGMRRVGFLQPDLETSSKARRLLEICNDALEDGRKIVIYSFFLETIEKVKAILGEQCVGVITGSTEITQRQGMIDVLAKSPAGSVLLCQIQAGGTGLNIQTASVVIFCEPQIKPSLTNQAIARVYRMGQVRNVLVHHLLCENTIDEAMVLLLEQKQKEFDVFADESSLAQALDELVDKDWIQNLIERENQKYVGAEAKSPESEQ